jgi:hypothetical protein
MAVDDVWYLKTRGSGGARLPSRADGRGKRWRVRWVDDQGEPRSRFFERRTDAERFDANVRADLSRGRYIDDRSGRITVAELTERWRADQLHIESTAIHVEHAIRLHILPMLGQLPIGRVRPGNVHGWVKDRSAVLAVSVRQQLKSQDGRQNRPRVAARGAALEDEWKVLTGQRSTAEQGL